ncbi:RNA-binding protein [Candidatus Peregrinibacteria bacterium]|nr:MAG: RNA-binding protein [Candidatus Peregrinibacteria bacterium]
MAIKLFVGSLAWATTNEELSEFFSQYGTVTDAFVVRDRETKRSKGFGFVEFENDDEGHAAIQAANGANLNGREIVVNEALPAQN